MCYSCMIICPGVWDEKASAEVEISHRTFASSIRRTLWLLPPLNCKGPTKGNPPTLLIPLDPNLTLTRTQYPATVGKAGNRKPYSYAGYASPCNPQQPLTAHS